MRLAQPDPAGQVARMEKAFAPPVPKRHEAGRAKNVVRLSVKTAQKAAAGRGARTGTDGEWNEF